MQFKSNEKKLWTKYFKSKEDDLELENESGSEMF